MFTKIRNKLEDFSRQKSGKEVLDRDLTAFLQEKYKEELTMHDWDKDRVILAKHELMAYFDSLELRPELLQGKTALDLGSNSHFFDEYCKEKYGTHFVALDIEESDLGKKHEMGVVADAKSLPFKAEAFDLVISHASMPHLFAPYRDDDNKLVPIEGEIRRKTLEDITKLFREAYRVLKVGGQIRMSTFSENEELLAVRNRQRNKSGITTYEGMVIDEDEDSKQQIDRVKVVKEALAIFEQEVGSGARCMFKDEEHGGLIIIKKV